MFKNLKLIFSPKNKDLRSRILFTMFGLMIFCIGTTIPVPGTQGAISGLGLWELLNAMGGGALKNFSIFSLGLHFSINYYRTSTNGYNSLLHRTKRKWCCW